MKKILFVGLITLASVSVADKTVIHLSDTASVDQIHFYKLLDGGVGVQAVGKYWTSSNGADAGMRSMSCKAEIADAANRANVLALMAGPMLSVCKQAEGL